MKKNFLTLAVSSVNSSYSKSSLHFISVTRTLLTSRTSTRTFTSTREIPKDWLASVSFIPEYDKFYNQDQTTVDYSNQKAIGSSSLRFVDYLENRHKIFSELLEEEKIVDNTIVSYSEKMNNEFLKVGSSLVPLDPKVNPKNGKLGDALALEQMMTVGMHLGHSTSSWHPSMAPFLFGSRQGIHIIDLEQSLQCLRRALFVTREIAALGGIILIVGCRPMIARLVYETASNSGAFYINRKWLKGTLTNAANVVKKTGSRIPGKATEMKIQLPDLIIVLDGPSSEAALVEAQTMNVPSIALIDSNFDPNLATYPIPGNDDALECITYLCQLFEKSILEGKQLHTEKTRKHSQSFMEEAYQSSKQFQSI